MRVEGFNTADLLTPIVFDGYGAPVGYHDRLRLVGEPTQRRNVGAAERCLNFC